MAARTAHARGSAWTVVALLLCAGSARPQPQAPAPLEGWSVGFTTTGGDVIVLIDEGGELYLPQRDFESLPIVAQTIGPLPSHLSALPEALVARLVGETAHIGDTWTIDVPQGPRIHATVAQFVLGYRNCGEAWGVLLTPVAADRPRVVFGDSTHVLARRGTIDGQRNAQIGPLARPLSTTERAQMARLLEQARLKTIDNVRGQSSLPNLRRRADPAERALMAKWAALDRALDRKQARLTFDATLYRLTPDGEPRVFVRARWMVGDEAAYVLAAWVRLTSTPSVDSVDATPARAMRVGDEGIHDWDRAIPKVLGVFDVNNDGRGEVLVRWTGYESISYVLIEYPSSPGETPRELAHYSDGC